MNLHNLPADLAVDDHNADMDTHLSNTPEAVAADKSAADSAEQERSPAQNTHLHEQTTSSEPLTVFDDRLQVLYDAYHTSYGFPLNKSSAHMQHAQDLAFALLQRHFPDSQGYFVEPAALGPLSAKGVNFVLKEDTEAESDPDSPPPKKQIRAARKTVAHYSNGAPWHHIEPEHMAAFVVKKRVSDPDGEVEHMADRTHTCLVILLDNLATFRRWSRDNVNHRGDVLCDMLGVLGGIERGPGMLFFGPRLELYSYDASNADHPVKPARTKDWRMDMRTTSLTKVDDVLHNFAKQRVVYKDSA